MYSTIPYKNAIHNSPLKGAGANRKEGEGIGMQKMAAGG
jgi:hypothetical protein